MDRLLISLDTYIEDIKNNDLIKLGDPVMISEITKHHIIALQETHCRS